MSHTRRILKDIASSGEYQAVVEAVGKSDYQSMYKNFASIADRLKAERKAIEESIAQLLPQNSEERRNKFLRSFETAIERIVPAWYQLNQQISSEFASRKIFEGEVFGVGKKGDPLVKTPQGVIVVLKGLKAERGERVRFKVLQETEKLNFGKPFELDSQSFYLLMTERIREGIRATLSSIADRLGDPAEPMYDGSLSEVTGFLQELEGVRKQTSTLEGGDKERVVSEIVRQRKRLLCGVGTRMMLEFISEREQKDVEAFFQDGNDEREKALLALGLFRRQTYEAARVGLLEKETPEAYAAVLSEMEGKVDSMDSVMKLMEFKAAVDEVLPKAKAYFTRMDQLFGRLAQEVKDVVEVLSREEAVGLDEIRRAIENAFPEEVLFSELRRLFRSQNEFSSLRGAFTELNRRLGNQDMVSAEGAFNPYLRHKIVQGFGRRN